MLVQVVALLSLGVLCSSAPVKKTELSMQDPCSSLENTIREAIEGINPLKSEEAPTVVPGNAMMDKCMHSYLKTFAEILAEHDKSSKITANLQSISRCKDIIPKDVDSECKIKIVMSTTFWATLDNFLRLLFETI